MFDEPISDCRSCPLGAAGDARCPFVPLAIERGKRLVARGEPVARIFFVRSGLASVTRADAEGREQALQVRGPGSLLCGEVLHGAASAGEIRALTPLRVCALDRDEALRWVEGGGRPARALFELISRELLERHQDFDLQQGESLQRVARLLVACGGTLPFSKQVAARVLGMRAETLSRCLRVLADRALVDQEARARVLDAEAVRRLAAAG